MTKLSTTTGATEIPVQIFERFLEELLVAGVSGDVIARLRKTLLEDQAFTEQALSSAMMKGGEAE